MDLKGVNMITCGTVNCFVVRGEQGDILIDTGTPEYRREIEVWLGGYDIRLIVLTHGHNDHIGSAAYFSRLLGAPIAMCAYDMKLAGNNTLHRLYARNVTGKAVLAASKKLMEDTAEPFDVDIFLDDGMTLGGGCRAVRLEGHTRGSFGVLRGGDLYLGDAAVNYFRPEYSVVCESPKAARESQEKIRRLKPERIFFGHGSPIGAGTKEYGKLMRGK